VRTKCGEKQKKVESSGTRQDDWHRIEILGKERYGKCRRAIDYVVLYCITSRMRLGKVLRFIRIYESKRHDKENNASVHGMDLFLQD
jgi:ribosomal protein S25